MEKVLYAIRHVSHVAETLYIKAVNLDHAAHDFAKAIGLKATIINQFHCKGVPIYEVESGVNMLYQITQV